MLPGVAGMEATFTVRVCAADTPQRLSAVTEIVPPVIFEVVAMLDVVEAPDQPAGKVQVYAVAPLTGATE